VEQADLELQLKVWKELAISKQVLMRSAAEALKLDPDCTQEELRQALEGVAAKIKETEASVVETQQKAKLSLGVMEQKLAASLKAQAASEAALAELRATHENFTREMATERSVSTQEIQKLKATIAERDKALKAINTALADTPENVLKKMNALKKQKQEEADARRTVEVALAALRKDKQQQDKTFATLTESSGKLVAQHRELHALAATLHGQLKPLMPDASTLAELPELDDKVIESVEKPDAKPEAKVDTKPGKADNKSRR
jgi:colicin import membrane protein